MAPMFRIVIAPVAFLTLSLAHAQPVARNEWYRHAIVSAHCDNHSGPLGMGQSLDDLTRMFGSIPLSMIQVSAQSDGPATYPTKVNVNNPDLKGYDTPGTFKEITRKLGRKLCIYMSSDRRAPLLKLHPDWAVVNAEGQPDSIVVCERAHRDKTGFLYEAQIPQIREIIAKYDPDGLWFDGDYWYQNPCWCPRCLAEWKADTGLAEAPRNSGQPNWKRWTDWNWARYDEYRRAVAEAIHAASPKCVYTSNWSWAWTPDTPPDFVDTLSGDAWDVKSFQYTSMRWGAQERIPWDLMSYSCGYRQFNREHSLQRSLQEGAIALSAGGQWFVWGFAGGQVPPYGVEIARHCAQFACDRESALGSSVSLAQVAVLDSETTWKRGAGEPGADSRVGCVARDLQDCQYLTDIVNEETLRAHVARYKVVVAPESRFLAAETVAALTKFARDGGLVVLTGAALRGEGTPESAEVAALLGLTRTDPKPNAPATLDLGGEKQIVMNAWGVTPTTAEVLVRFADGSPALTRNKLGAGSVAYLATSDVHYPDDGMLALALRKLGVGPSYTVSGNGAAPIICTLRKRAGDIVLHAVDLSTRVDGKLTELDSSGFTEPSAEMGALEISFPVAKAPAKVTAVPTGTPVEARFANGILTVRLSAVQTHAAAILTGLTGSTGFMPADTPLPTATPHPSSAQVGVLIDEDFETAPVGGLPAAPWFNEQKGDAKIAVTDATAASGKRSLKLTDAPDSSFWPFFHRNVPAFRKGRARLSWDWKSDAGVFSQMELRYEGKGPGPAVYLDAKGNLTASGKTLLTVPPDTWFHVDVEFELGVGKPVYTVTVTFPGEAAHTFADIPNATEWFYRCDSVYFVGAGETAGSFYLDSVRMERF